MPTLQEMNAWVQDTLGIDPEGYAAGAAPPPAPNGADGASSAAPAADSHNPQSAGQEPPGGKAATAGAPAALPDHDAEQLANTEKDAKNLIGALHLYENWLKGTSGDIGTATIQQLTVKLTAADKVADVPKRIDAYIAVSKEAKTALDNFQAANKNAKAIDWSWESIAVRGLKINTAAPELLAEFQKVNTAVVNPVWQATTIEGVLRLQDSLLKSLPALSKHIDDGIAFGTKPEKLKADLDARLAIIDKAVKELEENKDKKTWVDAEQKLVARAAEVKKEVGKKAQADLFSVGKVALQLIEKLEKASFAQQLAKPDGAKNLDKTIAGFGKETNDPNKQATCRAAISARFGLDVEIPDGLSVKRLPQLYAIMASVPPEDVNQDKFKKLEYRNEKRKDTSYYSESESEIVLQQIPEAGGEQDYERQDGSGAKETVEYFNATTLHEIGHGVDAKFKVMETYQGGAGYGKWKPSSMAEAVDGFYAAFFAKYAVVSGATEEDLRLLVRTLIDKGVVAKPQAGQPMSSLINAWTAISQEKAFLSDCWAIRMVKDPWKNPIDVGGTVYLESYPGVWWQYNRAERNKGISDYQWRAPGEWFAEVYALWHLKKVAGFPAAIAEIVKGKPKAA